MKANWKCRIEGSIHIYFQPIYSSPIWKNQVVSKLAKQTIIKEPIYFVLREKKLLCCA
jgi:hypothetical protein